MRAAFQRISLGQRPITHSSVSGNRPAAIKVPVVGPVVRDEPEGRADPEQIGAERVEDGGIGTVADDGVEPRAVEPSARVIVAQPVRDEHREVGHHVRLGQEPVHHRRGLASVALVDPMEADHPRTAPAVVSDVLRAEGHEAAHARIHDHDGVQHTVEVVRHHPAARGEGADHLHEPLVATTPRRRRRPHVEGHARNRRVRARGKAVFQRPDAEDTPKPRARRPEPHRRRPIRSSSTRATRGAPRPSTRARPLRLMSARRPGSAASAASVATRPGPSAASWTSPA